ncbi:MAG: hypothetical protein IPL40_01670 [Proteobacteria bacterium]|nr:hypothetical protein [Pseudomonadota bacterium]
MTTSAGRFYHGAVGCIHPSPGRLARLARLAILLAGSCCQLACGDSALAGLAGQWAGSFFCPNQSSEVLITIEAIDAHAVGGTAVVRTRDVDQRLRVTGSQRQEVRRLACLDDRCSSATDCLERGAGRCNAAGLCDACVEEREVTLVTLTLSDQNVALADPQLDFVRLGSQTLDGTLLWFCSGVRDGAGTVALRKR